MKTKSQIQKSIFLIICFVSIMGTFNPLPAQRLMRERNILANKAREINLSKILVTDNSWNKRPGYKDRQFWQNIPSNIKEGYISRAKNYLSYDWPVVKATDYLEIIRSGDRKQEVYSGPGNALNSLVMGELTEGKGRFMDQIINGVWYYCEQSWWGWSAKPAVH